VFTQNRFQAAPVLASRDQLRRLQGSGISSVLVNSGCANSCTGERGLADAYRVLEQLKQDGLGESLIMSTGVIGPFLPMEKLFKGVSDAKAVLSEEGWEAASKAIMTTDTVNKLAITRHTLPSSKTAYGPHAQRRWDLQGG